MKPTEQQVSCQTDFRKLFEAGDGMSLTLFQCVPTKLPAWPPMRRGQANAILRPQYRREQTTIRISKFHRSS